MVAGPATLLKALISEALLRELLVIGHGRILQPHWVVMGE